MKKTIAVVMGGYSAEREVSLNSGEIVAQNLNASLYHIYKVNISSQGWQAQVEGKNYPIDLNTFTFELQGETIHFDAVFNAVHGHPGEDGPLAGYFELLGLPHTSSGQFESALTFNKAECNILLQSWGFKTPPAIFLHGDYQPQPDEIMTKIGLPCFVKPSRSGSSIGISKVSQPHQLPQALAKAREIDQKVLVESMITGTEVGCGVSNHSGKPEALAVTDIVPKNEFFDYESKYSGLSEEVTPARITKSVYEEVMRTSESVYRQLGLNGLVRIDYIITSDNEPYLIEVNTVPGLSAESILPKQAKHAGLSLAQLFNATIHKALNS